MTNSLNKMAGKNSAERNGTPGRPRSTSKLRPLKATAPVPASATTTTYITSIATPPRSRPASISSSCSADSSEGHSLKLRLSPIQLSGSANSKSGPINVPSRTSPGLVAGHFAGDSLVFTQPK